MSARLYTPSSRGGLYLANARPISPGPNNQLLYTLDEGSTPWPNKGRAGSLDMTATSGTPTARRRGLFSAAMDFNGNSGGTTDSLATAVTTVAQAPGSWSMSIWALFRSFPATFGTIFLKQFRGNGTWTAPFTSCKLGLTNAANGSWDVNVTITGTGQDLAITGKSDRLTLNRWHLMAGTFTKDAAGSKTRAYLDGILVGTSASLGNNAVTDWNGTSGGRWCIGGNPQSTGDWSDVRLDDARFDFEAFDEAYWVQLYEEGWGFHEGPP